MIQTILAANTGATQILVTLFIVLLSAKVMAEVFERLRQPAVVGEILAGVMIGPSAFNFVAPSEMLNVLSEIGVIFLLFTVGLETKPAAIFRVGARAAGVAALGVIVPFLGGWLLMQLWGGSTIEALFLGTAMVATSVGITARVLGAMNLLDAPTARVILGAAVIDDILGLLVLAVVSSLAEGRVDLIEIGTTALLAIVFTVFVILIGSRVVTRIAPRINALRLNDSFFVVGLILCLALSAAATFIGIAAIIGAFLAGMALAEATENNYRMHRQTGGVTEFLVPFFLVNIGLQVNLNVFREWSVIELTLLVTLIAVVTKLIGCGAGALALGWRRAAQIGMGMVPRGEVGIVVAQIGKSLGVVSDSVYGVVLFMAVATTVVAPPFLTRLFASESAAGAVDPPDAGGTTAADEFSRLG